MMTIVSEKTQFGHHEDNFSEGLRRSHEQRVMKEQTALQKGVTPKNGEKAELGKLEKMLKRRDRFLKYFFNHMFCQKKVLHLLELGSQLCST